MPGEIPQYRGLSLRIVYDDLPDLIEVEVRVVSDEWSGVAQAYTTPASLAEDGRGLLAWSRQPIGEFAFEAGADTGIGWARLRWYAVDRAGHLVCHAQLASRAYSGRPESARRLALEFAVEAYAVERFANQLVVVAETLAGEAPLPVAT